MSTIFKSSEYSCLRICNVDDVKVIDRICTCRKLIFQPESNKHRTKMENQKQTVHKDGKSKQTESCRDDEITKTNERKLKIRGNHLFNYDKRKNNSKGDFGSKLTINHLSSIHKKKKGPTVRV